MKFKILAVLILSSLFCFAQKNGTIDWKNDIKIIEETLIKNHYNFFSKKSKTDLIKETSIILQDSKNQSNLKTAIQLQQMIASFGDSHTSLTLHYWDDFTSNFLFQSLWFDDGLYILSADQVDSVIIGNRIETINGFPLQTIIDSISTLISNDNISYVRLTVQTYITNGQILKYFGFNNKNELKLGLRSVQGIPITHTVKLKPYNPKTWVMFKPDSLALNLQNQSPFFVDYPNNKDGIYYIRYNKCSSREILGELGKPIEAQELPSFVEFETKVLRDLNSGNFTKIVIDLSLNGGGSSAQGTLFAEKIADFLKNHQNIKVYVVIGKHTFSSAILNAYDFKEKTNALFIGEESAGKPNHFGEVRSVKLPSSGLELQYSTKYFKRIENNVNSIVPDQIIKFNFTDYSKGINPVYEWIKRN